jgi:hypothetical protein
MDTNQIEADKQTISPSTDPGQIDFNDLDLPGPSSARRNKKIIKNYEYSPGTLTRARFCLMIA